MRMTIQQITIPLPEILYIRLQQVAQATQQSLTDVVLRAVQIGSPPSWDDVPAPCQPALAALDRLSDAALWQIAKGRISEDEMVRYTILLDQNAEGMLSADEVQELQQLRFSADLFMLKKAHAVGLLKWRGHIIPPAEQL